MSQDSIERRIEDINLRESLIREGFDPVGAKPADSPFDIQSFKLYRGPMILLSGGWGSFEITGRKGKNVFYLGSGSSGAKIPTGIYRDKDEIVMKEFPNRDILYKFSVNNFFSEGVDNYSRFYFFNFTKEGCRIFECWYDYRGVFSLPRLKSRII